MFLLILPNSLFIKCPEAENFTAVVDSGEVLLLLLSLLAAESMCRNMFYTNKPNAQET